MTSPTFTCTRCGETFDREEQNPWDRSLVCVPCYRERKNESRRNSPVQKETNRRYQREWRARKRAEREAKRRSSE